MAITFVFTMKARFVKIYQFPKFIRYTEILIFPTYFSLPPPSLYINNDRFLLTNEKQMFTPVRKRKKRKAPERKQKRH